MLPRFLRDGGKWKALIHESGKTFRIGIGTVSPFKGVGGLSHSLGSIPVVEATGDESTFRSEASGSHEEDNVGLSATVGELWVRARLEVVEVVRLGVSWVGVGVGVEQSIPVVGTGAGRGLEAMKPSGSRTKSWFVSSHLLRTSTMNGQCV